MMQKIIVLFLFTTVTIVYAAKAPFEREMPRDFSVEITETTAGGGQSTSKLYVSGPKIRKETWLDNGQKTITIMNTDKGIYYEIIPGSNTCLKVNVPPDAMTSFLGYSFSRNWKNLGDETLDGIPCIKYLGYATVPLSAEPVKNYYWVRKDNKMLKRASQMMPVMGKWKETVETVSDWNNVQIGSQPARLFEVPRGYKILDQSRMIDNLMQQVQ